MDRKKTFESITDRSAYRIGISKLFLGEHLSDYTYCEAFGERDEELAYLVGFFLAAHFMA